VTGGPPLRVTEFLGYPSEHNDVATLKVNNNYGLAFIALRQFFDKLQQNSPINENF
jgi:hypothetical protein